MEKEKLDIRFSKHVERIFGIKLTKYGKYKIHKWIIDEFGSIYMANKTLDNDSSRLEFISDMLKQENLKLDDISDITELLQNIKKELRKFKHKSKYCPYCGKELSKEV